MPKKFPTPTLEELVRAYLDAAHPRYPDQKVLESLQAQFQKVLNNTPNPQAIRSALALDTERKLPVQIKSPAYERLLSLEGRTIALLREYAQEMYEYGAMWTAYADRLWDEADALEDD
ncbi:MAG: hypothetical protein Kow00117_11790 [Phototrophicales bacterium]